MRKSDFTNRPQIFGRSNYLVREMLALVEHAEQNPTSAADLLAYWDANAALVRAAVVAAQDRVPAPEVPEEPTDPEGP